MDAGKLEFLKGKPVRLLITRTTAGFTATLLPHYIPQTLVFVHFHLCLLSWYTRLESTSDLITTVCTVLHVYSVKCLLLAAVQIGLFLKAADSLTFHFL